MPAKSQPVFREVEIVGRIEDCKRFAARCETAADAMLHAAATLIEVWCKRGRLIIASLF
jgi:hypothetical protein